MTIGRRWIHADGTSCGVERGCPWRDGHGQHRLDGDPEIGRTYRTIYGSLLTVTEILDYTRCSPRHVSHPLDVVVRGRQSEPCYARETEWSFELAPAQPGDRASHPHNRNCECGEPYERQTGIWYHVPASWDDGVRGGVAA